jgi:hypothetical protein
MDIDKGKGAKFHRKKGAMKQRSKGLLEESGLP